MFYTEVKANFYVPLCVSNKRKAAFTMSDLTRDKLNIEVFLLLKSSTFKRSQLQYPLGLLSICKSDFRRIYFFLNGQFVKLR